MRRPDDPGLRHRGGTRRRVWRPRCDERSLPGAARSRLQVLGRQWRAAPRFSHRWLLSDSWAVDVRFGSRWAPSTPANIMMAAPMSPARSPFTSSLDSVLPDTAFATTTDPTSGRRMSTTVAAITVVMPRCEVSSMACRRARAASRSSVAVPVREMIAAEPVGTWSPLGPCEQGCVL